MRPWIVLRPPEFHRPCPSGPPHAGLEDREHLLVLEETALHLVAPRHARFVARWSRVSRALPTQEPIRERRLGASGEHLGPLDGALRAHGVHHRLVLALPVAPGIGVPRKPTMRDVFANCRLRVSPDAGNPGTTPECRSGTSAFSSSVLDEDLAGIHPWIAYLFRGAALRRFPAADPSQDHMPQSPPDPVILHVQSKPDAEHRQRFGVFWQALA